MYKIRPALEQEAKLLTQLTMESKAFWSYSKEFLEQCRPHLTISDQDIRSWPFIVLELEQEIIGYYSLKEIGQEKRLDNLWIRPHAIKRGYGKILFEHAVKKASELGWESFYLAGEEGAIKFYEKMGAKLVGKIQSRLGTDLFLPHMKYLIKV